MESNLKKRVIKSYIRKGLLPEKQLIDKIMLQLDKLDEDKREESLQLMEDADES